MSEEEREFEKRKMKLINAMLNDILDKKCAEFLEKGEWNSAEDIDRWFTDILNKNDELRETIRIYYETKIYS